ncbi:hybrid sensor histidine kinase/response regulator [Alteromonas sp. ASW11-130]|uniref:hybrid sensor histidine kinase/response regulator n=1 Tax=Alteromonas sp. ASW11-130 TaxID=3015775 RepID=UPI0022429273|nr:hybrid sensor histidine kinase/response regulator [Alteromonas sp. ASW11-130]MCW8090959.1 ATP-binding protein [Alteromonas sp. ASW11-130]
MSPLAMVKHTLLILALFYSLAVQSQSTIQLFDANSQTNLANNFAFYFEGSSQLTISEAIDRRQSFQWHTEKNPNFGFHSNGLWLVSRFSNVSNETRWVFSVNFSQLDKVDFYVVVNGEVVQQSFQGKLQSAQRFRVPTLRSTLPDATPTELYIRVESHSSSLIVPLVVTPEPMHSFKIQVDSILWGLFYGGLVILAVYNLILYFGTREPALLAYVSYIAAVVLWQFIWGGHIQLTASEGLSPWVVSHTELIFIIIGVSSGIFTMFFLETKENARTAHLAVVSLIILQCVLGLVCILDVLPHIWKNNLVYGVGIVAILSYVYAGFEAFMNHFKPARYFIFAWSMLGCGALFGMLSLIGVLPSNTFTTYCFQVGVFLEAGLFSIALMEKSRSQLESEVEQATDDLRNNMELIEEQNARLDIARKDAIKASNVKSQFLANMSHEIRTPLNAILGFSRELNHSSLPSEQQEQARIISTSADNLLTIVNDVLDFSKIEAGKLTINLQPFSPNQLLEEMVTLVSKSAHAKRIEFVFELAPLPEKLIGDMFRIKQVLNNLLSNALKFTNSGCITLSAKGRPLPHGIHEIEISVEDTGIGISRHDKKKLFTAFSQVDDSLNRNYQGTGLGLVICRELVRLMRGTLHLKSTPGQGSKFTVTLRMNQLSQKFALTHSSEWTGKQIVLIDPVPETRYASASMLRYLGAHVTSVESLAYLKCLPETNPDYLFAVVPVTKLSKRDSYLSEVIQFSAQKRILWYSGPEPFNQYPSLTQHFHTQIRMPLTITKLESLLYQKANSNHNPVQNKINSLPSVRILAVDDMDMNLKLLHTWLNNSPVELTTTMNGQDAVNRCQTQEFDLILMDVQMPGMDGLQATQLIRKTALNLGTPIIAVTAHAFKEEQERLLASGMDDYLPKPIEIDNLVDLVQRWCRSVSPQEPSLPSIDWPLALKRSNHNPAVAKELLEDFINMLPDTLHIITDTWERNEFADLGTEVHRLHGACCYTGAPRLQELTKQMESALKLKQYLVVEELMPDFLEEARHVQQEGRKRLQEMDLIDLANKF